MPLNITVPERIVVSPDRQFPEPVFRQASRLRLKDEIFEKRSEVQGITIDGPLSKDLDDAIWVEITKDADIMVYVSIADVAELIEPDSYVEQEAMKRVTTRYYAAHNRPMIPRPLSEGALSLLEGGRRPCLTVALKLNEWLEISTVDIKETFLISQKKFNYAQADQAISDPNDPYHEQLSLAYGLSEALLRKRRDNGAMAFYDLQNRVFMNEDGIVSTYKQGESYRSHILIQELMILANQAVAMYLAESNLIGLFRNHLAQALAPERAEILGQIGMLSDRPELLDVVRKRMAMWFQRASYGPTMQGHFGLNLPGYVHFTSPIRRLPDLINHRIVKASLHDERSPYGKELLAQVAGHINSTMDALRDAKDEHFKMKRLQMGKRLAEGSTAELMKLTSDDFHNVIKVCCEAQYLPEPARREILRRVDGNLLRNVDIFLMLTESSIEDDRWSEIIAHVLNFLERNVGSALNVLQLSQDKGIFERFECEEINGGVRIVVNTQDNALYGPVVRNGDQHFAAAYFWRACVENKLSDKNEDQDVIDLICEKAIPESYNNSERNYVGELMEYSARNRMKEPTFQYKKVGPDHNPIFLATCHFGDKLVEGSGVSKKDAKHAASAQMLKLFNVDSKLEKDEKCVPSTKNALEFNNSANFVGLLQEFCVANKIAMPDYGDTMSGQSHSPTFVVSCTLGDKTTEGTSNTKKEAKRIAAFRMLKLLKA